MKDIVIVGSSNTDMIIQSERIPRPGETILGGNFATAAGGKGANQAVAAARAGGKVVFIARVGNDMFGIQALQGFERDGIRTDYIKRDPDHPSGVAMIVVDQNGENSIAVASGANAALSTQDVDQAIDEIRQASILLMQLESPLETVRYAAQLAHQNQVPVILNPAPARELDDDLLALVTIITPNETEAELLTGIKVVDEHSAEAAARLLIDKGVQTVIITLGSQGAFYWSENGGNLISGFKVQAVDTTAAGDTFNGALAIALAEDKSVEEAIRFANAAAALSVTKLGAQPSAPYRKDIMAMMSR